MRLLITGVSGLLGVNLAWLAAGRHEVVGVMRGNRALPVPGRVPFKTILADLSQAGEVDRILKEVEPDWIIHCAALTEVDRCEQHPEEAYRSNAWLPEAFACATARSGARLLHISTDSVFDGLRGDYTEEDEPHPINVYAQSKLEGERRVAQANPEAIVARVNFYGWSWQGRRSLAEFFFHKLADGQPVTGFADIFFSPLLVNDMTEILLKMLNLGLAGLYHVSSCESLSKYEFACLLARNFGFDEHLISPVSYHSVGLKAPRAPRLSLRSDRLASVLGEPMPGLEPPIARFVDLYRQGYPETLHTLFAAPNSMPAG